MIKKQTRHDRRDTLNNDDYIRDVVDRFKVEDLNGTKINSTFSN